MSQTLDAVKDTVKQIAAPVQDAVSQWTQPFQRTQPQRDAARMIGHIGIGSLGFGAAAAAAMMLRRKHERALLDEEKAKALLEVPVYVPESNDAKRKKESSLAGKALAAGLGTLGLGGTIAGLAYSNQATDGKTSANPAARVFNSATNVIPGGKALRDEQDRYLDIPGTIRGEHAKTFTNVPWFAPGALGVSLLGLGAGYSGVNAAGDFLAKRKLQRKKKKAKKMFEEALMAEQQSKLGSALEEFVTSCEQFAPSVKEASLLEWYLALLGTAGVAGGMAGTYHGYQDATQKHRLSALKKIRQMQLAKRRGEELSLVPVEQPMKTLTPQEKPQEEPEDDPAEETIPFGKSADLVRTMARGLWRGGKYLGNKAMQGVKGMGQSSGLSQAANKATSYLAKEQPLTTLTVGTLAGAEGLGRLADHYNSPWGRWKPSTWVFNRFADNQPLTDSNGKPVWGTRRLYSADPNDHAEMKWSWNPLSERGFGWRFRRETQPRRRVIVTNSEPGISELVKKSNPSITMRRKMNERFYDYEPK